MKRLNYFMLLPLFALLSCSGSDDTEPTNPTNPETLNLEVRKADFSAVDYYYHTQIYVNGEIGNDRNSDNELLPTANVESGDVVRFRTRIGPDNLVEGFGGEICIIYRVNGGEWSEPMCIVDATNDTETWYYKDVNGNTEIAIE